MVVKRRYRVILLLITIIALMFSGCAREAPMNKSATESIQEEKAIGFGNTKTNRNHSEGLANNDDSRNVYPGRKVIKSGAVDLETKEFDKTLNGIMERTKLIGGYIEKSHITGKNINSGGKVRNRRAHFILRVPEVEFENFLLDINTLGNVISRNTEGKDITNEYFDREAHLKTLTIQEERLLEILKKAEKVEDIIHLEKELSRVRYEIENLTGTLKKCDNLVSFATLEVSVYEVYEVTEARGNPTKLGRRIEGGFKDSIEILIDILRGLLVLIARLLPFTVVIVPLVLFVLYIIRKRIKVQNKKSDINKE